MKTLIGTSDTWTLWAVIMAGTGAAIWLEQTYRWAAKVSAPLLALGLAMVLSNTHRELEIFLRWRPDHDSTLRPPETITKCKRLGDWTITPLKHSA